MPSSSSSSNQQPSSSSSNKSTSATSQSANQGGAGSQGGTGVSQDFVQRYGLKYHDQKDYAEAKAIQQAFRDQDGKEWRRNGSVPPYDGLGRMTEGCSLSRQANVGGKNGGYFCCT